MKPKSRVSIPESYLQQKLNRTAELKRTMTRLMAELEPDASWRNHPSEWLARHSDQPK